MFFLVCIMSTTIQAGFLAHYKQKKHILIKLRGFCYILLYTVYNLSDNLSQCSGMHFTKQFRIFPVHLYIGKICLVTHSPGSEFILGKNMWDTDTSSAYFVFVRCWAQVNMTKFRRFCYILLYIVYNRCSYTGYIRIQVHIYV